MPIHRLNHAVLYVRDVARSVEFYVGVLGFIHLTENSLRQNAAFLRVPGSTNDHDVALFGLGDRLGPSEAGSRTVGLYHLGWELDTLDELEAMAVALSRAGALVGATNHGTSKSLYGVDPDGLEFEIEWLIPADLLDDVAIAGRLQNRPLDIASEIARYGGQTVGGIGISRAASSAP